VFESDVFAFGLILYQLIVGQRPFSGRSGIRAAKQIVVDEARPASPEFVLPDVGDVICECWAAHPDDRPQFDEILSRLEVMQFKATAGVKSAKVAAFVERITEEEPREVSGRQTVGNGMNRSGNLPEKAAEFKVRGEPCGAGCLHCLNSAQFCRREIGGALGVSRRGAEIHHLKTSSSRVQTGQDPRCWRRAIILAMGVCHFRSGSRRWRFASS
jgi:hypothetical protein